MAKYQDVDRGPSAKTTPYASRNVENAEVAEAGPALCAMRENLDRIATLLGGTEALRAAERTYLPQHTYESDPAYERRLQAAYLNNYTLRTLNTLVGKAFKEPPQPAEEMPEPIVDLLDDVDDAGTALVPFAREWFRKGVEQAVAHVLVDAPIPPARPDGQPRTLADDYKDGLRPFWRLIPASEMLDYQVSKIDGKSQVSLIRFRDDEVRANGLFKTELVQRVKVIHMYGAVGATGGAAWELWELRKGPRGGKPKWEKVDDGPFGLPMIPVATFYTDRSGPGEGRSPLADLAHMNIRHWQSTADQINILTVSRFPMLAASGVREEEGQGGAGQIVVGPNKFLTTPDPQSKIYFVEHTGAAVSSGKEELDALEEQMASYGAEFLKKGAQGPESASGRVLDAGDAISPLQSWGLDFRDCLALAGYYTAQWLKLGEDVETPFEFEVDSDVDLGDPAELSTLDKARERKDISREAWVEEMKLRSVLRPEYDPKEDQELIEDEPPPPGMGLDGMAAGLPGAKPKAPPPTK